MKGPRVGFPLALVMMAVATGVQAQSYRIGGKTYLPTGSAETVSVTFTVPDGGVSAGGYYGLVRLVVSGSGVSCTPATNDAFYIHEWQSGCSSPPQVPAHDSSYYQLTFDSQPLIPLAASRTATRHIFYDVDAGAEVVSRPYVPAYRPDHTYSFIVDTGLVSAGPLHFGVSDGGFTDNSGSYQVQVTQLVESASVTVGDLAPSSPAPFAARTAITWTATATGGTAPLQYRFWLYDYAAARWTSVQDYSPANTWTWTPQDAGTYGFQVWVRSAGSTADYDAWRAAGPFEVNSTPVTVTGLTTPTLFPVAPLSAVTWTATATGGTPPLEYQFWLYHFQTARWEILRPYATQPTATWTPSEAGRYVLQVWVRSVGSTALYEGWKGSIEAVVEDARPTLTEVSAQPSLPVSVGTPVTWTATATGGAPPVQYCFWLYDYGTAKWTMAQDYSPAPLWVWTPQDTGTYGMQVWVRSSGSSAQWQDWRAFGPFSVTNTLTVTSFSSNVSPPVSLGTPVTLTATAGGTAGPIEYQFWLRSPAGSWSVLRDYALSQDVVWTPGAAGVYFMQVWARQAGSSAQYQAWKALGPFEVTVTIPTVTALTASQSPLVAGAPMTWTATATGGAAPLQYQFWLYTAATGTWTALQDYSSSNQAAWTPPSAGQYALQVWVRGTGSAAAYEAWRTTGYFNVQ